MDKAAAFQWGTKARQQASVRLCEHLLLPAQAGDELWGWGEILGFLPRSVCCDLIAVPKDGLMSLLLLQRDAGSGDKAVRMAGSSAAAANWNNTVTPSTSVKLLVIFEYRAKAQRLRLGTEQWEKSSFSVCFHPALALVPLPMSKTAVSCLK